MEEFERWLRLASQPNATKTTEAGLYQQMRHLGFDQRDFQTLLAVVAELR